MDDRGTTHLDRHSIQLHVQYIVNQRLVCPGMGEHRDEVDIAVKKYEHCRSAKTHGFIAHEAAVVHCQDLFRERSLMPSDLAISSPVDETPSLRRCLGDSV